MPRKNKVLGHAQRVALVTDSVLEQTPQPVALVSEIVSVESPQPVLLVSDSVQEKAPQIVVPVSDSVQEQAPQAVAPVSDSVQEQAPQAVAPVSETVREQAPQPVASPVHAGMRSIKPSKFGAYTLVWEICRDALSTTWAATRDGIERPLALRIFNARVTDSAQIRSIQKAARQAHELTHANIVSVYENGVSEDGAPYVVTEWTEGETLTETFADRKRLDIATFLSIFEQVCEALTEAHSHALVHGNLSPSKIIMVHSESGDADTVKLIDFGMPVDPIQNAFYLSPEQSLDRHRVSERSDIYSLGCIMYESLVGSPPFVGNKITQASTNFLHELANQYDKETPEHNALKLLDCIIIKCLQKKPSQRFRSARELHSALKLVNDCICAGSKKKLPPRAEKLLLFRFLDFFDKKVVIGGMAYLTLGMLSLAYIGELQLQQHIDTAVIERGNNHGKATQAWKAALKQAQLSNKPPSLVAQLEWEVADSLLADTSEQAMLFNHRHTADQTDEAIKHYDNAYNYYRNGRHYRGYALALLNQMTYAYANKPGVLNINDRRDEAVKNVKKLFKEKKYKQCIEAAKKYLLKFDDSEISYFAACANNEIGTTVPVNRALNYFLAAEDFFYRANRQNPIDYRNTDQCLTQMGYDPTTSDTALAMAHKALLDVNLEAFSAISRRSNSTKAHEIERAVDSLNLISKDACTEMNRADAAKVIPILERSLALKEEVYGKFSTNLDETLKILANAYEIVGNKKKAVENYERLFKDQPELNQVGALSDVVRYVDLLCEAGNKKLAREILEKCVINNGEYDAENPLFIRMLQLYRSEKLNDRLERAVAKALPDVKPTPLPKPAMYQPSDRDYQAYLEAAKQNDVFASGGSTP